MKADHGNLCYTRSFGALGSTRDKNKVDCLDCLRVMAGIVNVETLRVANENKWAEQKKTRIRRNRSIHYGSTAAAIVLLRKESKVTHFKTGRRNLCRTKKYIEDQQSIDPAEINCPFCKRRLRLQTVDMIKTIPEDTKKETVKEIVVEDDGPPIKKKKLVRREHNCLRCGKKTLGWKCQNCKNVNKRMSDSCDLNFMEGVE